MFQCFEDHGLRPFPNVPGWDRQTAIDRLEACLAVSPNLVEAVDPNPRIGVNNPALFFWADDPDDEDDDDDRTCDKYNYPPHVMFDLAGLGVGTLRHLQEPDLAWLHLLGKDQPIAPPDKMRSILTDGRWRVFGSFTYTVITALFTGQRIIPLLFGYGGGANQTDAGPFPGAPDFQLERHVPVPVDAGWDPWYWDFTGGTRDEYEYQQFGLNLWTNSGRYAQECCYRKCLGLLEFSTQVGEYLALLATAIEDCSENATTLTDVVPAIECGNEMDSFYVLTDDMNRQSAAREFGRYHALLTGPIMAKGLGLKARLGETFFDYGGRSSWTDILTWLRETITLGVVEEVDRWIQVALHPTSDPLWSSLAQEAGWTWWTTPFWPTAGSLVHEVGFHAFTWVDTRSEYSTYQPETEFYADAGRLVSQVAQHADVQAALRHDLEWSCCVGFQGSRPYNPSSEDKFFADNTLAHQAGMVVRRMLAAHIQPTPPAFVTWYGSMGGLTDGVHGWDLYSSAGLRNVLYGRARDVAEPSGPLPFELVGFSYQDHAWPRPAWHTLRRLAWLLARADRVELVHQNAASGAMVIRLVSEGGFSAPLAPVGFQTWRYAYIAWLDGNQAAAAGTSSLVLTLSLLSSAEDAGGQWQQLPLVPSVSGCSAEETPAGDLAGTDDYGFAGNDAVDWGAIPSTSSVTTVATGDDEYLEILVYPSEPSTNPAPICVLCDLEVQGISSFPPVVSVPEVALPAKETNDETVTWSDHEHSRAPQNEVKGEVNRRDGRCNKTP
ncbi:MAG: hypothetical protein ABIO70_17610 [Pseudomonadota bacterium]